MIRILAWFFGEGDCPVCGDALTAHEAGYHLCTTCDVVVDYTKGGWRYHGESKLRRLPGVIGLRFDRDQAA